MSMVEEICIGFLGSSLEFDRNDLFRSFLQTSFNDGRSGETKFVSMQKVDIGRMSFLLAHTVKMATGLEHAADGSVLCEYLNVYHTTVNRAGLSLYSR